MILDGEIVALGADGRPVLQCAAESRAAQERSEIARAQRDDPGRARVLRPAAFRGTSICAPHPTAIGAATSRSACCPRRTCNWCMSRTMPGSSTGRARERLRGHGRQAPRQSLPARAALGRVAQVQSTRSIAEFWSAATRAARVRARHWVRCCSATGDGAQAALRRSRRLGTERRTHRGAAASAAHAADPRALAVRRRSRRCIGRRPGSTPRARGRGQLQRVDAGWAAARAGVRAAAR